MASYHFSAQTISRKAGRSSVKAAAYRAGIKLDDHRTGEVCDYSRKKGVLGGHVFLPGGGTMDRGELWNKVESHHKRGDAVVAREFVLSLPRELSQGQRQELAFEYAASVAERYGVAADANLHAPDRVTDKMLEVDPHRFYVEEDGVRHNANWHMHLQVSACYVAADGQLGKKCVELDPIHMQRINSQRKKDGLEPVPNAVEAERALWADMCNRHLEKAGIAARVDHRSFKDQGIDQEPATHHGPAARGIEAKTGQKSDRRMTDEAAIAARAREAAAAKIQEATITAEFVAAQREVDGLQGALSETRELAETNPEQNIIDAVPSSDEIRKQLEQVRQKLFDPHERVARSKVVNATKAELDGLINKRIAVFDRLWACREDMDNRIPLERKRLKEAIATWRKKHLVLAALHDNGVIKNAELASFQRALNQLDKNQHDAGRKYYQELKVWNSLRDQYSTISGRLEKAIAVWIERENAKLEPLQAEVDRLEGELAQALVREEACDAGVPDDSLFGDYHRPRYQRPRN